MTTKVLICLSICLVLVGSALAEIETETVTLSQNGLTDFYGTLALPQFDPDKGDLLGVSLGVSATIDGYFFYENLGVSMGGYRINQNDWTFSAAFLGSNLIAQTGGMSTQNVFVTAFDGVEDYAGTSGATVPYADAVTASAGYLPADPDFASWVGTGTLPLDVSTTIWTSFTTYGSPSHAGLHTDTVWTATITWTFDPASVPTEASSFSGVKALFR